MKCSVCNEILTEYESTLKHGLTKKYLDTCLNCIKGIGNIPVLGRNELLSEMDLDGTDSLLEDNYDDMVYDDDSYDADLEDYWSER